MPSMRQRRRYIMFKVNSSGRVDFLNVRGAVWDSIEDWLGKDDLAKADAWIMKNLWNSREQSGFIRCNARYVDNIKVALSLIHQIGDQRVILQTLRVSGTIRSAKAKAR